MVSLYDGGASRPYSARQIGQLCSAGIEIKISVALTNDSNGSTKARIVNQIHLHTTFVSKFGMNLGRPKIPVASSSFSSTCCRTCLDFARVAISTETFLDGWASAGWTISFGFNGLLSAASRVRPKCIPISVVMRCTPAWRTIDRILLASNRDCAEGRFDRGRCGLIFVDSVKLT